MSTDIVLVPKTKEQEMIELLTREVAAYHRYLAYKGAYMIRVSINRDMYLSIRGNTVARYCEERLLEVSFVDDLLARWDYGDKTSPNVKAAVASLRRIAKECPRND